MQAENPLLSKGTFTTLEIELDGGEDLSICINKPSFPLHEAAKSGNAEELTELLKTHDMFQVNDRGRTPLHYAVSLGNHKQAEACTQVLLDCTQVSVGNKWELFVNIQDDKKETALHLAAKNESKKIAQQLIECGAAFNLKSEEGKEPIDLIFAKVPAAMVWLLDNGVHIMKDCDSDDQSDECGDNLKLGLMFIALFGIPSEEDRIGNKFCGESRLLACALDESPSASKDILEHPFVQLFLELKWRKIYFLFWFSIAFHIAWLIVYTAFIAEVYLRSCPYHLTIPNTNTSDLEMKNINKFTWFGISTENVEEESELNCLPAISRLWVLFILIVLTGIVLGKEMFEMTSVRKARTYFTSFENIGQWLIIISVVVLTWPIFFSSAIYAWIYEVAAFGILIAWSLVLAQIGKHPKLGLHVEILMKVLKSFGFFMLVFASLLMAFALSLSLLLPGNAAFVSLPLALMKVMVMMTGELNYDEFFNDQDTTFPISTRIIYLFFIVVVSITLFNLLIGFTVSDIQGLQKRAKLNKLSSQLEQIFLMESFILSKTVETVLGWFNRKEWLEHFLVAPCGDGSKRSYYLEKSIKEIPSDLQESIRKLAFKNAGFE